MSLFGRLKSLLGKDPESGDTPPSDSALVLPDRSTLRKLIRKYSRQTFPGQIFRGNTNPSNFEAGRVILESAPEVQVSFAMEVSGQVIRLQWGRGEALRALLSRLYRRSLPFSDTDLTQLLKDVLRLDHLSTYRYPLTGLISRLEKAYAGRPLPVSVEKPLRQLHQALSRETYSYSETRKQITRIENLLRTSDSPGDKPGNAEPLAPVDNWTRTLCDRIQELPQSEHPAWNALLIHLGQATASKPSARFQKTAAGLIAAIGNESFRDIAFPVLEAAGKPGPVLVQMPHLGVEDHSLIHERYADHLRGLIWCCIDEATPAVAALLGDVAERCFRKVRGLGPRSIKTGNACITALGAIGTTESIAQLSRLKNKLRQDSARTQVDRALERAAVDNGLSAKELEEVSVPSFGMTEPGLREEIVNEFTACLTFTGSSDISLKWRKPDGKTQASVPKAIKDAHPEIVKQLRARTREIQGLLVGQEKRIERFFFTQPSWRFEAWAERYRDQPLLAPLARRLIWRFENGDSDPDPQRGLWIDGRFLDSRGDAVTKLDADTRVSLWHPIDSNSEEVQQWRKTLARHLITQPFKQAHREIYRLSETERETRTYSNRFAAHILKQHQFAALCQQRGWDFTLMGGWDSANVPTLDLPEHGLRVEFQVEPANARETSEAGIFLYLTTDQARFYHDNERAPIELDTVPARVLSETMRDIDFFVGVCSVANDPTWSDTGPGSSYYDYWRRTSFGDLSATAQTRHDVLSSILPKLKIAGRCELQDRFLVVHGHLRSYSIHLGSTNIQMTPDNQFLCLEPTRSRAKSGGYLYLPFEGDTTLSVILSKAFLLSDDDQITDSSIVSQIEKA